MKKNNYTNPTYRYEQEYLIPISGDLLYQTWIDIPISVTGALYSSLIRRTDRDEERFRLFRLLEVVSSLTEKIREGKGLYPFQLTLGKFRYDLTALFKCNRTGESSIILGFTDDSLLESDGLSNSSEHKDYDAADTIPKFYEEHQILDHNYEFFIEMHQENPELAKKLYYCTHQEFFKETVSCEYLPGKKFYFVRKKINILLNPDGSLRFSENRLQYLQVSSENIIQKAVFQDKRSPISLSELSSALNLLSDFENGPSLNDLFEIYNPNLKYIKNFPQGIKYPRNIIIKRKKLYTPEAMASYLLNGISGDQALKIIMNLDSNNQLPVYSQIELINTASYVSKKPKEVLNWLIEQDRPYHITPLLLSPYRDVIILADRLGYQVDWDWNVKDWESIKTEWTSEADELLSLIPLLPDSP